MVFADGQLGGPDRPVAISAANVQKPAAKFYRAERAQKIQRSIEVNIEVSIWIAKRFGDTRPCGKVEYHVGPNRLDILRQSRIANVVMIAKRRDRPTTLRLGANRILDCSTNETRMAREQQRGHGGRRIAARLVDGTDNVM